MPSRASLCVFLGLAVALILSSATVAAGARTSERNAGSGAQAQASPRPSVAVPEDPYHQVVDDATPGRFRAPGWQERPADGQAYGRAYAVASEGARAASFRVEIPKTRYYSVYARWPASRENARSASFGVPTPTGLRREEVNQRLDGGYWIRVGAFRMQKGERTITLEDGGDGRAVADAVMVVGDAMVAPDGTTASFADPEALADGETAREDEPTFSAQSVGDPTRADVVRVGRRHIGTTYRYGGLSVCNAFETEDCSCFTRLVFRRFGYTLPDSPGRQWSMRAGKKIFSKSRLRRGDLVFHDYSGDGRLNDAHDGVAIYSGNGNVLHASSYFGKVVESKERYLPFHGAKRLRLR